MLSPPGRERKEKKPHEKVYGKFLIRTFLWIILELTLWY